MMLSQFFDDLMLNLLSHTALFALNLILIVLVVVALIWAYGKTERRD